jgi:hypothetical protein
MQASRVWLDRVMVRLLFIPAPSEPVNTQSTDAQRAERAFGFSLVFSGVRCILQYAVLPFLLPLVGIAAEAALPILLIINVLAVLSIFYSLRRFWQISYQYRWQYLVVAMVALVILITFTMLDLQTILG